MTTIEFNEYGFGTAIFVTNMFNEKATSNNNSQSMLNYQEPQASFASGNSQPIQAAYVFITMTYNPPLLIAAPEPQLLLTSGDSLSFECNI